MNFKYQSVLLLLLALFSGCSVQQAAVTATENDPYAFFNVVYEAASSREKKGFSWFPVQGTFRAQFLMNPEATSGTFTFYYDSYCEPQFAIFGTTCSCSGTAGGTFDVTATGDDAESASVSASSSNLYNPNTPYNVTGSDVTQLDGIAKVASFRFSVRFTSGSMIGYCRPGDAPRELVVARFVSGEVVIFDSFRMINLKPKVVN